ncbi:hypothetical protein FALBO_17021 [Fusarium albosuccineum]|uniref:Uncharacterized protein n=1 Tax=Fusarium albosuccineum TaxID=1237068 RepID=A0A8H4KAU2_9HYPO|nr:hypothetical protein FALBO_17021 [Fusarium albosuccineum]
MPLTRASAAQASNPPDTNNEHDQPASETVEERNQTISVRRMTSLEHKKASGQTPKETLEAQVNLRQFQRLWNQLNAKKPTISFEKGVTRETLLSTITKDPTHEAIVQFASECAPLVDEDGNDIVDKEPIIENWLVKPRSFISSWVYIKKRAQTLHEAAQEAKDEAYKAKLDELRKEKSKDGDNMGKNAGAPVLETPDFSKSDPSKGVSRANKETVPQMSRETGKITMSRRLSEGSMPPSPPLGPKIAQSRSSGFFSLPTYGSSRPKQQLSWSNSAFSFDQPRRNTLTSFHTSLSETKASSEVPQSRLWSSGARLEPSRHEVPASGMSLKDGSPSAETCSTGEESEGDSEQQVRHTRQYMRGWWKWWVARHRERYGSGSKHSGYKPLDGSKDSESGL